MSSFWERIGLFSSLHPSATQLDIITLSIYRYDEVLIAANRPPSPESENPFDDLDEGTRNLIRDLLCEKDEARQNYYKETKKTHHLEVQLEVARTEQVIVRAQLTAVDSRVASKSLWFCKATPINALDFCL